MTEQEWLTSEDPVAMLHYLTSSGEASGVEVLKDLWRISDRKLRLFACACCWVVSPELGRDAEQMVEWNSNRAQDAVGWARCWCGDQKVPSQKQRATLLRCLVGNPFRPVTLCGCGNKFWEGSACRCMASARYWLTPNVLAVARAAYEDRGTVWKCRRHGAVPESEVYEAEGGGYGHASTAGQCWQRVERIEDGTLDPVNLAVLADALEEAGCPAEVKCEECLRYERIQAWEFMACHGTSISVLPNSLLAHLRSPGPHYRGCFAVDLVLGKE